MIELEHFCDRSDRWTMFEDLKVLDLRNDRDRMACRSINSQAWSRVVVAVERPRIIKIDGSPDQRYRDWWNTEDKKLWPLIPFAERMERIAAEGDMLDPDHRWKEQNFRPAQVESEGVYLFDWRVRPIYRREGYIGFLQNVMTLLQLVAQQLEEVSP